uniref:Putative secreted protein n=1 Tax=Anopheles marajoara TaxID=58244 RepID=A0A2M4C7X5_9DIPT
MLLCACVCMCVCVCVCMLVDTNLAPYFRNHARIGPRPQKSPPTQPPPPQAPQPGKSAEPNNRQPHKREGQNGRREATKTERRRGHEKYHSPSETQQRRERAEKKRNRLELLRNQ